MEEKIFSDFSAEEEQKTVSEDSSEVQDSVPEDSSEAQDGVSEDITSTEQDRREYEELIRNKFKKFYTEDTQKMINKRFRKYKELEARAEALENERAQFEDRLRAECEKSAKEAEQRIISGLRARHARPGENGIITGRAQSKRDVSTLTRTERADMARRASRGEIIKI